MLRKRLILGGYALVGGGLAISILPILWRIFNIQPLLWLNNPISNFVIGAAIFFVIGIYSWKLVDRGVHQIEVFLNKQSPITLLVSSVTTIIGLAFAVLISTPLTRTNNFFLSAVIPVILLVLFGYLGFRLGSTRIEEWRSLIPTLTKRTRVRPRKSDNSSDLLTDEETNYHHYKILDTNILIDGRIADLVRTGFIEGTLLVPNFVLYELQYIADAGESIKRVRGRRGLDILNELRETDAMPLEMWEGDYDDIKEVDEKLIRLAKDVNGILVTNDYNLNKVVTFQNVDVLNINELAGALRPRVAVGDKMRVQLVRNGTERKQAVGYLDDGTMIVVEDGRDHLQENVTVEVTSSLQTDAGRMIFGNLVQK